MSDKIKGNILDFEADPPRDVSWRFYPKRTGGKVDELDMIRELFDQGMDGNFYVSLFRVPDEYPPEGNGYTDLYDPETACKILADLCHYTLYDNDGHWITGGQ